MEMKGAFLMTAKRPNRRFVMKSLAMKENEVVCVVKSRKDSGEGLEAEPDIRSGKK